MPRKAARFIFNEVSQYDSPSSSQGLVFAVRTDARHATELLKNNIVENILARPGTSLAPDDVVRYVDEIVHGHYKTWGHDVLRAIAGNLDYGLYGLDKSSQQFLNIHFYDSRDLALDTLKKAEEMVKASEVPGAVSVPPVYISLDGMIDSASDDLTKVEFSRVFSFDSDTQSGYTARPGTAPLDEQIDKLCQRLKSIKEKYGADVPFVLVEDNVRHARMLNWFITKLEDHGVFDYGRLAGIATCFCCAPDKEREAIRHNGQTVPLAISVDYKDAKVDVTTPRDFLFEGYVVQVGDKTSRLPGIFMDVTKLYKIRPDRAEQFREKIYRSNLEFCCNLEAEFDLKIPLSWFVGADAVAHVTGHPQSAPIVDILRQPTKKYTSGTPSPAPPQ